VHPIRGVTVITIIRHPVGCIIGVSDKDSWGRRVCSRRWRNFGVGGVLLFFIGVVEDDDIAVVRRPKKTTVKVIEELPGELLIP
jgi:hypothetical protein